MPIRSIYSLQVWWARTLNHPVIIPCKGTMCRYYLWLLWWKEWVGTTLPLLLKYIAVFWWHIFLLVNMFLHLRMGQESVPKGAGVRVSDYAFSHLSGQKLGFSYATPKPVSIWLSLSAIKVHELKQGSPYLSKTLRAVKSLNNVMTHLLLPGLETWDPLVMPPGSSPCCHPGVLGAQPQTCPWMSCNSKEPAQHRRFPPGSGRGNLSQEYLRNRAIPQAFPSCHHGAVENCCCLLCIWTWNMGQALWENL